MGWEYDAAVVAHPAATKWLSHKVSLPLPAGEGWRLALVLVDFRKLSIDHIFTAFSRSRRIG